jgi:hypothetical protein
MPSAYALSSNLANEALRLKPLAGRKCFVISHQSKIHQFGIEGQHLNRKSRSGKDSSDLAKARSDLARAGSDLVRTGSDLAWADPDLARADPDLAKAGPDLAKAGPDLARAGPRSGERAGSRNQNSRGSYEEASRVGRGTTANHQSVREHER